MGCMENAVSTFMLLCIYQLVFPYMTNHTQLITNPTIIDIIQFKSDIPNLKQTNNTISMNLFTNLISNDDQQKQPVQRQKSSDFFFCLNARQYFNIEQQDIYARIKSAIMLRPVFSQVIGDKPDLYGPFWISTTLIVVIVASSSLMLFFTTGDNPATYNFNQISVAASLVILTLTQIYGISFACPYVIALLVKIFGGMVSVVDVCYLVNQLICIYGYSLTMFLPITAFCFIKSHIVQIALLGLGFVFSTIFLIRGIFRQFVGLCSLDKNLGDKERYVLGVFILGTQILLVFMYKFYFFDLI